MRSLDVVLVEDDECDDIETFFVLWQLLPVPSSCSKSSVPFEPSLYVEIPDSLPSQIISPPRFRKLAVGLRMRSKFLLMYTDEDDGLDCFWSGTGL